MYEDLNAAAEAWMQRKLAKNERFGYIGIRQSNGGYAEVNADAGRLQVNITLEDGTIAQALCSRVTPRAGAPVIVKRVKNRYVVDRVNEMVAPEYAGDTWMTGDVGLHHHLRGGGLEYMHEAELFAPGAVYPNIDAGGLFIVVNPIGYFYANSYQILPETGLDLTTYVPGTANTKAPIAICIDPITNTVVVVSGTAVSTALPAFTRADYDAIDYNYYIPLMGISLTNGQTGITDYRRDFISLIPWSTVPLKSNHSATAAPTTGDDADDGYSVGSLWVDVTNDDAYLCVDATAGAAVWEQLNGGGGGGSITIDEADSTPSITADTLTLDNGTLTDLGGGNARYQPFYQTIEGNGSAATQRRTANFADGTGITVAVTDDAGNGETDIVSSLDIDGLTEEASVESGDFFPFFDVSAGLHRKTQASNIPGSGGGGGTLIKTTETFYTQKILYENTLSSPGTWDVSSISQDYDSLIIELYARSTVSATVDIVYLSFNNDTTNANYRRGFGTGGSASTIQVGDDRRIGFATGASSPADYFAINRIFIADYTGDNAKIAHNVAGSRESATTILTQETTLHWENTAAIDRITVTTDNNPTDTFAAGSFIRIIGVKESTVVTNVTGGLQGAAYSTDDVSNPPTDAELDTAFGTPATVGAGYAGIVNDAGAGTALWFCVSDGSNWWYNSMTKAL